MDKMQRVLSVAVIQKELQEQHFKVLEQQRKTENLYKKMSAFIEEKYAQDGIYFDGR